MAIVCFGALTAASAGAHEAAGPLDLVTSISAVHARQIEFQGDFGWIAQNFDGASLVKFDEPRRPHLVRRFSPDEMQPLYLRVFPERQRLYSADRFRGFVIYNISVADKPTTVSVLPLARMTTGFDVAETTSGKRIAVLSRAADGVIAVDISDETKPSIVDTFTTGVDLARAVLIRDNLVYVADGKDGGLKVLRLTSEGTLQPLYQVNYRGMCQSLSAAGDYLVVGYGGYGFRTFEFPKDALQTTPILKLITYSLRNRNRVKAAVAAGGYLFTANEQMGIDMMNQQRPAFPVLCDEFFPHERDVSVQSLSAKGSYLYASSWDAGVLVFRFKDAPAPDDFNMENLK